MAIKIPDRNYLTFGELQLRWGCTEPDLRYVIMSGELKPSVRIDAELPMPNWQEGFSNQMEPSGYLMDEYDVPLKIRPHGWLYLQEPFQNAPFGCHFSLISDDRDAEKPDEPGDFPRTTWYCLPEPMNLDRVASDAVFLLKEVVRYEDGHGECEPKVKQKGEVPTRERDTLLKLVIGMAMKGYRYDPAAAKSSSTKDIADDLVALGMSVSDDTVRKYLKEAANTVLPAKPRQS